MNRKVCLSAVCVILIGVLAAPGAFAFVGDTAGSAAPKEEMQMNLTDAQKKELKELYEKKFEVDKQIIQKYVDFGLISKDRAEKKLERMEMIKKKLEENGYAPLRRKEKKGEHQKSGRSGEQDI